MKIKLDPETANIVRRLVRRSLDEKKHAAHYVHNLQMKEWELGRASGYLQSAFLVAHLAK